MSNYKKLSNITFITGVESISRKFALRKIKCTTHANQQGQQYTPVYIGAACRLKPFRGTTVKMNYMFLRQNARTNPLSEGELTVRENFRQASRWVKAAWEDLSAVTANQQKFVTSKKENAPIKGVSAVDYGMRGWMFAIAMAMLGNDETLPTNHQLPAFDA